MAVAVAWVLQWMIGFAARSMLWPWRSACFRIGKLTTGIIFMAERDYKSSPISDILGLRAIIDGLASDLQDLRQKKISPADGLARAALAKQVFNGVRLYIVAARSLEGKASPVRPRKDSSLIEGSVEGGKE
jgi:hypothetical protein